MGTSRWIATAESVNSRGLKANAIPRLSTALAKLSLSKSPATVHGAPGVCATRPAMSAEPVWRPRWYLTDYRRNRRPCPRGRPYGCRKHTPHNVIDALNAAVVRALADRAVCSLASIGEEIFPRDPQPPEALAALQALSTSQPMCLSTFGGRTY